MPRPFVGKDIIKIQVDGAGSSVLVYNESHTFYWQQEFDESDQGRIAVGIVKVLRMKPYTKKYIHAEVDKKGVLHLGADAGEQDW